MQFSKKTMKAWIELVANEWDRVCSRSADVATGAVYGMIVVVSFRKPYIVARAMRDTGAIVLENKKVGIGITKVKYPDEWDTEFGALLAVKRALKDYYIRNVIPGGEDAH